MSIYYIDALAGSGKTRALARYADWLARLGKKVIIAQPSKLLIQQTLRTEINVLGPTYPVNEFHGDVSAAVVADLSSHIINTKGGGEIVFTTHAALLRLPRLARAREWRLLMDEVPQVDKFEELTLPETHHLLTDFLDLTPRGAEYGELSARGDQAGIGNIARNRHGDSVFKLFEEFAHRVMSEHWSVYALLRSYESMVRGEKAGGRLTTYSLLNPSIFDQFGKTIIASACFEHTLLYQVWASQGVKLRPCTQKKLLDELRYLRHQNGDLITIAYVSDEDWSKKLRDRTVMVDGEQVRVLKRLVQMVGDVTGGEPFAWMGNNDLPDDLFAHLHEAARLPNSPHGINSFQHLHQVVIVSALNPPPAHFTFMGSRGITGDEVRTGHYRTAVYQALMRISIRDPYNTEPKLVVVMDRDTAYWLADLFPGAQVTPMSGLGFLKKGKQGRTRVHATTADRKRAYRERQAKKWFDDVMAINGTGIRPLTYRDFCSEIEAGFGQKKRDENTFIRTFCPTNFGSALASKYATRPFQYLDLTEDDDFIGLLRDLHDEVATTKEDNILLSPACFDPDVADVETSRGLANITHVRGIWLDNDGGDLTHHQFADLFPHLRIVVWNTHSSTPQNPRWRAFIPTTYAMSVDVHRCIMARIETSLHRAGYRSQKEIETAKGPRHKPWRCHGFDTSKFNAASLFYAPCQAAHPDGSFFVDYNDKKRAPLDLCVWLEECVRSLRPEPEPEAAPVAVEPVAPSLPEGVSDGLKALQQVLAEMKARTAASSQQSRIEKAINTWKSAPPGTGNDAFFRLAVALKRAGLDDRQIRQHLSAEANGANSPSDRRNEIRSIMRSLSRAGTFYNRGIA